MKNKLVLGTILALVTAIGSQSALAKSQEHCKKTAADGTCIEFSHKKHVKAGPEGFSSKPYENIKDILSKAQNKEKITVQGKLTNYLGGEKYEFTDDNNDTITVDLEKNKDWSFISKDMPIEILAKVDKGAMSTQLDVIAARAVAEQKQSVDAPEPTNPN